MIKKIILIIVVAVTALALWWQWYARQSLPLYSGTVAIFGIDSPVLITFDKKGIPQIWAESEKDMYFALGWQHASERLFQMELIRHVAKGRLAEIMGEELLDFDINIRRLGFETKAIREINGLSETTRSLLQAYLNGVNASIGNYRYYPPEFLLLGFEPEEWDLTDIGAIFLYQTWFSHAMINGEKWDRKILDTFGKEIEPFMAEYMNWSPGTLFKEDFKTLPTGELFPLRMTNASNSVVISPEKSLTGAALLESDPHMPVNLLPGYWYAAGIHAGDSLDAVGITVPSLPFMVMGHNTDIAWAFTVSAVDLIDYYAEPLADNDSLTYKTPDGWKRMKAVKEYFYVKGEEKPVEKLFYKTRHGVVTDFRDSVAIAMHWAGDDFNIADILDNIFSLPKCKDFNSFREIVTYTGALSANWTYADKKGNIGYQLGTPIPVRDFENSIAILPGDSSKYDWRGFWPLEATPHVFNPKRGWLATCNNQIISQDSGLQKIPGFYDPYRIIRATEILSEDKKFGVAELRKLQMDLISSQALRWKGVLAEAAERAGDRETALELRRWNGSMDFDSRYAGLFQIWWETLPIVFLGDELDSYDFHSGNRIKEAILTKKNASWVDNVKTVEKDTWEDGILIAYKKAKKKWAERPWKELIRLSFKHILSRSRLISLLFDWDAGEYAYRGSNSTLNASFYLYHQSENEFETIVAPSMRMVVDFAALDSSVFYLPVGQSGHPYSPHYKDFTNIWLRDKTYRLPIHWEETAPGTVSRLNLIPVECR